MFLAAYTNAGMSGFRMINEHIFVFADYLCLASQEGQKKKKHQLNDFGMMPTNQKEINTVNVLPVIFIIILFASTDLNSRHLSTSLSHSCCISSLPFRDNVGV